jgi:hypothetical protein
MKQIITLVLFTTMSFSTLLAQEFRLGVQVSPTFSWMNTNTPSIEGSGTNLGLELGLLGDYYFDSENKYAISSGITFMTNQGGGLTYSQGGNLFPDADLSAGLDSISIADGTEVNFGLQYIEIPLSVKLRGGSGDLGYYVQLPAFGLAFPIKGRADISNFEDENILGSVIPLSFTWGLGAGAEYNLGDVTLVGGLAFQSSILDIIKDDGVLNDGVTKEDSKQNLNRLTVRVGIFF